MDGTMDGTSFASDSTAVRSKTPPSAVSDDVRTMHAACEGRAR
jgi:hypothetical protein